MTTLAQASSFNAEASLNAWMQAGLQAFSLPAWLNPLPAIVYDAPDKRAAMPCFSLIHIPVNSASPFMGRWAGTSKGAVTSGILDVSCWVSRAAPVRWTAQLRTMRDMVLSVATNTPVTLIYDYAALPRNTVAPVIDSEAYVGQEIAGDDGTWSDTPLATAYKINIGDVALTPTEPDKNPDVERVRILIDYNFVFRVN